MSPVSVIPRIALLFLALGLVGLAVVAAVSADDHLTCIKESTATDSDGDGLSNEIEDAEVTSAAFDDKGVLSEKTKYKTDPNDPDSDDDDLCDGEEINGISVNVDNKLTPFFSNPTLKDTDRDGIFDAVEFANRTNPSDPNDPPKDPPGQSTTGVTVEPGDKDTGVPVTTSIKVTFSGTVQRSTVDPGNFALLEGATTFIVGAINRGPANETAISQATLTPAGNLKENTTYTVKLADKILDSDGNPLKPFTSTFTTGGLVNNAPVVKVSGPNSGVATALTPKLDFTATVTGDDDDGTLLAALEWYIDGQSTGETGSAMSKSGLEIGSSVDAVAAVGPHTIEARLPEGGNVTGSGSIQVTLTGGDNLRPVVIIDTPSNNENFTEGDEITFTGTATDKEGRDITAELIWTLNTAGDLGTGGTVKKALTVGPHTITASVTISEPLTGTATVQVTVAAAGPSGPIVDEDNDGLDDRAETSGITILIMGENVKVLSNPTKLDTDEDGLTDGEEVKGITLDGKEMPGKTHPNKPDTDGDGLEDGEEVKGFVVKIAGVDRTVFTNPTNPDTDGDGIRDRDETLGTQVNLGGDLGIVTVVTDPSMADTDEDGDNDLKQSKDGRDPTEGLLQGDADGDGLLYGDEIAGYEIAVNGSKKTVTSDPSKPDTDGDGLPDNLERGGFDVFNDGVMIRTDPSESDTDGDGLDDLAEIKVHFTDPTKASTDGDILPDGIEINGFEITVTYLNRKPETRTVTSDPLVNDTDGDKVNDKQEETDKTDPRQADTDGDGLSDFEEKTLQTDPSLADTDDDGLPDGLESKMGTDPNKKDHDQDGIADGKEVFGWTVTLFDGNKHRVFSNPLEEDTDGDGLFDQQEAIDGFEITVDGKPRKVFSDPSVKDTDGDGLTDSQETTGFGILVTISSKSPASAPITVETGGENEKAVEAEGTDAAESTDKTPVTESKEETRHVFSDPWSRDTDSDGLFDAEESKGSTITIAGIEKIVLTDPSDPDTDNDGKPDKDEVRGLGDGKFVTDPTMNDTDGDGTPDNVDKNPLEKDSGFIGGIFGWIPGALGAIFISGTKVPFSVVFVLLVVAVFGLVMLIATPKDDAASRAQSQIRRAQNQAQQATSESEGYRKQLEEQRSRSEGYAQQVQTLEARIQSFTGDAQIRGQEVETAAGNIGNLASQLGEREWVDGIIQNLPNPRQQSTALDDRYQVLAAVQRRLQALTGQFQQDRDEVNRLAGVLQQAGLETNGIRQAAGAAPATALPFLRGALQDIAGQHQVSSEEKTPLLAEIDRAKGLCNREIMDAVARRIPLSFLDTAQEMLEGASTAPELKANLAIANRILDDIFRYYFPRTPRAGH